MLFIGWEMKYNENSHSCGQLVIGSFIITCTHSYIMSHAEFFGKTSNHPNDSAPYDPDLAPWYFWLFPKLKSPLKGTKFQTIDEIQENMTGQLMVIWKNCARSQGAYFEWDWGIIVLSTMFLVYCIFFNKWLFSSEKCKSKPQWDTTSY